MEQIKCNLPDDFTFSPEIKRFLGIVSDTYVKFETDDDSSKKAMLINSNNMLRVQHKHQEIVLDKLKKSIKQLCLEEEPDLLVETKGDDILYMLDILQGKIREFKNFEDDLKTTTLNMQAVIENTEDLIWSVDEYFRFKTFNSFFKSKCYAKYKKTPEIGDSINLLLPDDDFEIMEGLLERAMNDERFTIDEMEENEGKIYYFETSFNPIKSDNKVTGVSVFSRDITGRIEDQKSKNKLVKELKAANEELRQIAYIISHDLKSPLRSIGSIVSWLQSDFKDIIGDNNHHHLEVLLKKVEWLYKLIDGISHYMGINADGEDQRECLDLNKILNSLLQKIEIPDNFEIQLGKTQPKFFGNKSHIQILFSELIHNAIRFNNKDRGIIKITFTQNPSHLIIYFSDNGKGINPKYQKRVFKIFQTLNKGESKETHGIGLALVKKIIALHEGEIEIKSQLNKGVTFIIKLPSQN